MHSIHFWSVQAMFLFMAVHFITNFFTMCWRGGRGWTWITGVLCFFVSILTAFTGFLMMTNWDSEWIGQQAKDAFNAMAAWPSIAPRERPRGCGSMTAWQPAKAR